MSIVQEAISGDGARLRRVDSGHHAPPEGHIEAGGPGTILDSTPLEGTPDNPAPLTEHDARLETLLRDAIASVLDCFAAARPGFEEAVHLFNQGGVTCDKLDSNRPERDGWETFGAISRLNDLATLAAATAIILTDSSVRTGDPDAEPEDWPTRSVLHRGRTFVGGRIHVEDGIYRIDAHVVAANEVIDLDAIGGGR